MFMSHWKIMADKIKKTSLLKNQEGQAVFEMIIFLPFLVFLYSIYYTTGNSISGSINQQKAVRGYFYSLTKGNSYLNTKLDLNEYTEGSIKSVGFSALGWREKTTDGGKNGYSPCFKFSSMLKNNIEEPCDSPERDEESSSRNIRVFTYYGVCGPVFNETTDALGPFYEMSPFQQNNPKLCSIDSSPPN